MDMGCSYRNFADVVEAAKLLKIPTHSPSASTLAMTFASSNMARVMPYATTR